MKKLLILLIFSFFSLPSYAGSCPDGSDPVKSISADGTYFVYNCAGSGLRRLLIKEVKGQRIYIVDHFQRPNKRPVSFS